MIKLYLKGIIVLLLFSCLFIENGYGQRVITYNFKTPGVLDGIVPFDRPFRIKFQHVDSPDVKAIVVKIYQVGVTNYQTLLAESGYKKHRKSPNGKRITLTNEDLLKYTNAPVIEDSLVEGRDFSGQNAQSINLITLKASASYFIKITTYNSQEITASEKNRIYEALTKDDRIGELLNAFAKRNIDNPKSFFDDPLATMAASIRSHAVEVIKSINKDYILQLSEKDLISQLSSYGEMYSQISNITPNLKNLQKEAVKDKKVKSAKKAIFADTANEIVSQIDWSSISDAASVMTSLYGVIPQKANTNVADYYLIIDSSIQKAIIARDKASPEKIYEVITNSVKIQSAVGNTFPEEFVKQANQFITSDVGLAYVWGIGRVSPYIAAQISLSPLDDSIPLGQYKGLGNVLRSRTSFMIGMSVDAVAKDSVRKGIVAGQALILGAGFKLWAWLKLNGGFYLYYREPVNPTLPRGNLTFTGSPFISLSIDVRVQSLLNGVGNAIFPHTTN